MSRFIIIRHAQASIMKANYDQLSDLGKEQSAILGEYLAKRGLQFDKIYRGDLRRHRETEQIASEASKKLGYKWDVEIMPALNEHQGPKVVKWLIARVLEGDQSPELQGIRDILEPLSKEHPKKQYLAAFEYATLEWAKDAYDTSAIEVEDWRPFRTRIDTAYERIMAASKSGETIGIFTSGGPMGVAIGKALQLSDAQVMRLNWIVQNTAISEFLFSKRGFSLKTFNMTPHLEEERLITLV